MKSIYVVDTGQREVYVRATDQFEAAEAAAALGEGFEYVEFFSNDPADVNPDYPIMEAS